MTALLSLFVGAAIACGAGSAARVEVSLDALPPKALTPSELDPDDDSLRSGRAPRGGPALPLPRILGPVDLDRWVTWLGWTDEQRAVVEAALRAWESDELGRLRVEYAPLWERCAKLSGEPIDFSPDPVVHRQWKALVDDARRQRSRAGHREAEFIREIAERTGIPLSDDDVIDMLALRTIRRDATPPLLVGVSQVDLFEFLIEDAGWNAQDVRRLAARGTLRPYLSRAAALSERRVRQRCDLMGGFPGRFHQAKAAGEAGMSSPPDPIWNHWTDLSDPNAQTETELVRLAMRTLTTLEDQEGRASELLLSYLSRVWPEEFDLERTATFTVSTLLKQCTARDDGAGAAGDTFWAEYRRNARTRASRRADVLLAQLQRFAVTREKSAEHPAGVPEDDSGTPSARNESWRLAFVAAADSVASLVAERCPDIAVAVSELSETILASMQPAPR